jgi:hypothetical protein
MSVSRLAAANASTTAFQTGVVSNSWPSRRDQRQDQRAVRSVGPFPLAHEHAAKQLVAENPGQRARLRVPLCHRGLLHATLWNRWRHDRSSAGCGDGDTW